MREILFRGKRVSDGKWEYGFYVMYSRSIAHPYSYTDGDHYIQTVPHNMKFKVDPETVCQYTGLTDKNGKKIFEGDIIKYTDEITDKEKIAQIEYCEKQASFVRVYKNKMGLQYLYINERIANKSEVTGNIFDNSELLAED